MRKLRFCFLLFLGLLPVFFLMLHQSQTALCVDRYLIRDEAISAPVRIVQLSDLHNSRFGPENSRLIQAVAGERPDLILLTGDFLTSTDPETEISSSLVRELSRIAPVYFSLGNHEIEHADRYGTDIAALFPEARVLDREYLDLEVNGQALRLGGIYGYCLPAKYLSTGEADAEECAFLTAFQDTDRYTLLMSHNPVCWMINGSLEEWDADLVFGGHAHGGQIVLPLLGGVYGPDLGFFPGRMEGIFNSANGQKHLVLSRGLGSSLPIPRLNNPPQIVVVELMGGLS